MSAIKDARVPVTLGDGKEYKLLLSLNAIDSIQDRFGDISKLGDAMDGKDGVKSLRFVLTLLINEGGADDDAPEMTEKQVGHLVNVGNMNAVKNAIFAAFNMANTGTIAPSPAGLDDDDGEKKVVT